MICMIDPKVQLFYLIFFPLEILLIDYYVISSILNRMIIDDG